MKRKNLFRVCHAMMHSRIPLWQKLIYQNIFECKLLIKTIGKNTGVPPKYITNVLFTQGDKMSMIHIRKICDFYNVTLEEGLTITDDKPLEDKMIWRGFYEE